jgi:hypothetical protein
LKKCTSLALLLLLSVSACRGRSATKEERAERKRAQAAAALDRAVLQSFVKRAEEVEAALPSWAQRTAGFQQGDTNIIWRVYAGPDSATVLDEHRRAPDGGVAEGRYFFRRDQLWYTTLDQMTPSATLTPRRVRLAFGFDSLGALVATSKNVNDAAVPLDSAQDVGVLRARASALLTRTRTPR